MSIPGAASRRLSPESWGQGRACMPDPHFLELPYVRGIRLSEFFRRTVSEGLQIPVYKFGCFN